VFAKQAAIDQWRQILAALGGQLETALDQLGPCRHVGCDNRIHDTFCQLPSIAKNKHREKQALRKHESQKKEQGTSLALTIVSTLFPRKFGFDFD
jgi:hypothetical protein